MNFKKEYQDYQNSIQPSQDFLEKVVEKRSKSLWWRKALVGVCVFLFLLLPSAYFAKDRVLKSILGGGKDETAQMIEQNKSMEESEVNKMETRLEESQDVTLLFDYLPRQGIIVEEEDYLRWEGEDATIEIDWRKEEVGRVYTKKEFTLENLLKERKDTFILDDGERQVYVKIRGNLEEAYQGMLKASWLE